MYFLNEQNKMHKSEVQYQTALAFVKHLKKIISTFSKNSNTVQLTLSQVYENFEYPEIAYSYHISYSDRESEKYFGDEQAHRCALLENMIEIDSSVRPNKYILKEGLFIRPYQKIITEEVANETGSVLIEAPTGAGKSVIASQIAFNEIFKGGKVLIVAPKIILLDQLKETFKELNPQIIHGLKDYDNNHNVFISTIQTAYKRELGFEPTMILIDEVHFGFDGIMINQLLEDFRGRLIGLSATPYDRQGKILEGFEKHINNFDLEYMIKYSYLHYPACYTPVKVNLSNISIVAGDYNQGELDRYFNNQDDIFKIVNATKKFIENRNASIVFCINISHAKAVAEAYNDIGIPTAAIHSELSQNAQKRIMDDFKFGKLKLLANPMILTTGFDYPATDTIILARPTKSQNLFRQMVGRGLRLSENKEDAVILDCAGVIQNLGLPTEKIKEIETSNAKVIEECKECGSEKLYRIIKDNSAYKKCGACGNEIDIKQKGYECDHCNFINAINVKFFTKNNSLYMKCIECEQDTLISSSSTTEELVKIFDKKYIEEIQKRITLLFIEKLFNEKLPTFLTTQDAINHIKALHILISKEPQLFLKTNRKQLDSYHITFEDIDYKWEYADHNFRWGNEEEKNYWRIFDQKIEDKLLFSDNEDLLNELEKSNNFEETIKIIQELLKISNKKLIEDELIDELISDINHSKLKDISIMCNKRIKDIFYKGYDFSLMKGFVGVMESVL